MDLRLDVIAESGCAVVRIHHRLAGVAVPELERVCRDPSAPLILDLTHLMSADDAGIATLRRLMSEGAQCRGTSPYLALRLDRE